MEHIKIVKMYNGKYRSAVSDLVCKILISNGKSAKIVCHFIFSKMSEEEKNLVERDYEGEERAFNI